MNSQNSKTFDLYRLLLNLSDKIKSNTSDTYITLSNLRIYYTWKNIKSHKKTINLAPTIISAPMRNEKFK